MRQRLKINPDFFHVSLWMVSALVFSGCLLMWSLVRASIIIVYLSLIFIVLTLSFYKVLAVGYGVFEVEE